MTKGRWLPCPRTTGRSSSSASGRRRSGQRRRARTGKRRRRVQQTQLQQPREERKRTRRTRGRRRKRQRRRSAHIGRCVQASHLVWLHPACWLCSIGRGEHSGRMLYHVCQRALACSRGSQRCNLLSREAHRLPGTADAKCYISRVACCRPDPDPDGAQLAATPDPLGEATKLLQKLKQHAADRCRSPLASACFALCCKCYPV